MIVLCSFILLITVQFCNLLTIHTISNRITFFFQILFKNTNVFMFFNFEPNFIEKFLRGSVFFKFWSRDFSRNDNLFLGSFVLLIYGCFGCIHIWCQFRTEIPTGKYSKLNESKWIPPCAQTGVKSTLCS